MALYRHVQGTGEYLISRIYLEVSTLVVWLCGCSSVRTVLVKGSEFTRVWQVLEVFLEP